MPPQQKLTIRFRLICVNPPSTQRDGQPTVFGLQDKQGVLQPGQPQPDGSLVFEFELEAKPADEGKVNFLGAYAQGTVDQRFVYLSLGYANDSGQGWIKRLKIPLSSIRWEQAENSPANRQTLEATVDGRGAATVPLIGGGWIARSV